MESVRLKDMIWMFSILSEIKEPSEKIQEAKQKLEEQIYTTVISLKQIRID